MEMLKKENIAGRLHWQGKAQAHRKRFFLSPTTGSYHNFCDLIWKIVFTFVEKKSVMTYLKQILHKTSSAKRRIDIKLEKLETYLEIINLLFSKCSPIYKTVWKKYKNTLFFEAWSYSLPFGLHSRSNKTNNQNHLHTLLNFRNERERKK